MKGAFSGHFTLRVVDARNDRIVRELSFPNLITNQGLAGYCGASPNFTPTRICVGNGTAAPAVTDTALQSLVAISPGISISDARPTPVAPDYVSSISMSARFAAGTFSGTSLTEIGITNNVAASAPVFSRALIVDASGAPIAITILANEHLDVVYTLNYHPDLTDSTFSFAMDGVTYTGTARAAFVGTNVFAGGAFTLIRKRLAINAAYNTQELGAVTGEPMYSSGGKLDTSTASTPTYLAYSSEKPYTHGSTMTIPLNRGNFTGGIGAMLLGGYYIDAGQINSQTQVSFSPKIPKDVNTVMTFTIEKTLSRWQGA